MVIREIVEENVKGGAKAKDLVIGITGLVRTLGTMATMAAMSADNRRLYTEAVATANATSQCEMLMRFLVGSGFIQRYQFIHEDGSEDDEDEGEPSGA